MFNALFYFFKTNFVNKNMELIFKTGSHSFLMPSEQLEEIAFAEPDYAIFSQPDFTDEHIELEAWKCKWAAERADTPLLIESNLELAELVNADGIILKREDLPATLIREKLGTEFIIFGVAHHFEDVLNFAIEQVDAILLGPLKTGNQQKEIGLEGVMAILSLMRNQNIETPVYIYGYFDQSDVLRLSELSVKGIVVSENILDKDEPDLALRDFIKKTGIKK